MKNSDAVVRYWRKSLSDESYAHITIGEGTRDGFLLQDGTAGDWKIHKDVLAGINHPDGGSFVLGIGALTRGRTSSRVTCRHLDHGRSSRVFMSRSNRPYGLTCSHISGVRAA